MFNAITFNASLRRNVSVFGLLFFAAVMVLLPIPAQAQCGKTWDASGEWEIRQGRGGKTVTRLDLKQSGSALSGKAYRDAGIGTNAMTDNVVGDAEGDTFMIGITWVRNGEITVYRAKVSANGKLEGEVTIGPDKRNRETWYSDQPLTCSWTPGKSRGNLTGKPSANDTAKPGQGIGSRLADPVIVAGQPIFPNPYNPMGFVILSWDAGSAYPNADVWVKYNGSRDRVLLMKQPKGVMQVPAQRGLLYTYVLMDGRTVLGTATFVVQ
jgi:hypothetical protein